MDDAKALDCMTRSFFSSLRRSASSGGLGSQLIEAAAGAALISVVGMGFTFLVGIQLARGLGLAGYGVYGLAIAVVSMLGVPSQFGIPQLLMREVAAFSARHRWPELHGVMRWAVTRVLGSTMLVSLLLWTYVLVAEHRLGDTLASTLAVGALMIPLVALGALSGAALRGLLHSVYGQLPDYLIRPAAFSAILALIFVAQVQLTPAIAMGAGVLSALCALVLGAGILSRKLPDEIRGTIPLVNSREWTQAAFPMALAEGLRVVEGQAAILALGFLATLGDVGLFRVAASVMGLLAFPLTVFNLVASPAIARLHALGDRARLQRLLGYVAGGMSCAVILLSVPFVLLGDRLLAFFFGREFGAANPILLVLAVGVFANAAFGVGASFLNMVGQQARVTRASMISVAALCVLLWPLILLVGGLGAAIAVAFSMTLWSFLLWRDAKRSEGFDISLVALLQRSPA